MLKQLHVRDFQSIRSMDLDLGSLTVVVGASNSGKSALLRALKALAHNSTSTSFVRAGSARTSVGARTDDGTLVVLERGPSLSKYIYAREGNAPQEYPKAGMKVPQDVADILRFPEVEGEPLNFAFQFDRPFLLDWPAPKVAKALGDLSNVNLIYEAVREANRRKLEAGARLKVRRGDVESLEAEAETFADLDGRLEALDTADGHLNRATALGQARDRLATLTSTLTTAARALKDLEPPPEPPPLERAEALAQALRRLQALTRQAAMDTERIKEEASKVAAAEKGLAEADEEHARVLAEAGICPTCGQVTG